MTATIAGNINTLNHSQQNDFRKRITMWRVLLTTVRSWSSNALWNVDLRIIRIGLCAECWTYCGEVVRPICNSVSNKWRMLKDSLEKNVNTTKITLLGGPVYLRRYRPRLRVCCRQPVCTLWRATGWTLADLDLLFRCSRHRFVVPLSTQYTWYGSVLLFITYALKQVFVC